MSLSEILVIVSFAAILALIFSVFWRKSPPKGEWRERGEGANLAGSDHNDHLP
jgi:FtsZ-interacting cell division protein ZipA